jgi:hypothetical protein
LLQWLNPIPAGFDFLSKLLVSNKTFAELWTSLEAPFVFTVAMMGLLFVYFGPKLSVEVGRLGKVSGIWSRLARVLGRVFILCLIIFSGATSARAYSQAQSEGGALQISISMDSKTVKTGDGVNFDTVVSNAGTEMSSPVIVAMNIINLSKEGDVVDPEDWSPERTQYLDTLAPGESATLSWQVNAVLDGDYMVYIVAVPQPENAAASTDTVSSRGLHLSVTKFTSLNPGGVLPFAVGVPIVIVAAIFLLFRLRNRQVDAGETS